MFLTRMALDVNRPETADLLASPARIREEINAIFPGWRTLWRLDDIGSRTWIVMLSHLRPDLLDALMKYGYPGVFPSWETICLDDDLEEMWTGTVWDFELCASPTGVTDNMDGTKLDKEWLKDWLIAQGRYNGFRVDRVDWCEGSWIEVGDKHMLMAAYTGRMTVTDESCCVWAITNGIGGGTQLGAGLMTIARRGTIWG